MKTVTEVSNPESLRSGACFVRHDTISPVSIRRTFAQHGPLGGFAFFLERDIDCLNQFHKQLAIDGQPVVILAVQFRLGDTGNQS